MKNLIEYIEESLLDNVDTLSKNVDEEIKQEIERGSNDFRRDRDGNVIVTRLNEQMCQEIAKAGNGLYIRVDNTNSAEKILNNEIAKLAKADVESQVFTEFDEQFQALAWLVLVLLVVEILILERKNPLFKNIRLFK